MTFLEKLTASLRDRHRVVVFPEGADERILAAAGRLVDERIARVVLLGAAMRELMARLLLIIMLILTLIVVVGLVVGFVMIRASG